MSKKEKQRSGTPRKKTEDKFNFQGVFQRLCIESNARKLPIGKVLSTAYRPGYDVKLHSHHFPSMDFPNFFYYIQNENYEKEGTIVQVIFKNNRIDSVILNALNSAIDSFDTLSDLRLINCKLTHEDITLLSSILQTQDCLIDLTVDENPNRKQNFYMLFENNNLQYISLQKCQINDLGASLIGNRLKDCKSLISLDLSNNFLNDDGAKSLAEGLRVNRSLVALFLIDNLITDTGIEALMAVLKKFELRQDEIELRRKKNFEFEFKKLELRESFHNLKIKDNKSLRESRKSELGRHKSILKKDKQSISGKRSNKSSRYSNISDPLSYIQTNLKMKEHPFQTECVAENGSLYCPGNFKLSFINLSYNKVTESGLSHISGTLQYQNELQTNEIGLTNVLLNGIWVDQDSPIFEVIKSLVQQKGLCQIQRKRSFRKSAIT